MNLKGDLKWIALLYLNMKKIILLCFILINHFLSAQQQNNIWCFGDSSGIDFNNINNPLPIASGMRGRGSCVSICDSSGNLVLYSFTVESTGAWSTHVFNNTHTSIAGADSITGEAWYSELALLPKPYDTTGKLFDLFSIGLAGSPSPGLYVTTIDMNLNGGIGGLLQENLQIDNLDHADCLTAIQHGNGEDWWLISKKRTLPITTYNRFFVYHVSGDTAIPLPNQDFNDMTDVAFSKIIWHPSGNKFMLINVRGYMKEFNFDRCSGQISLNNNIYNEQISNFSRPFWSGAYSSNGNLFYTARTSYGGNYGDYNYLLQYDLTATDIPASCDTLDSTLYPIADCGDLRLAPDGKIYYSQAYPWGFPYKDTMYNYINMNLGVINDPNVVGGGCNFQPFSFYLGGKRTYYGLPNNPNYSLGPLVSSPCDTLSTSITTIAIKPKLNLFYHYSWQTLFINANHLKGKEITLQIVDLSGRMVYTSKSTTAPPYFTKQVPMSGWSDGLYIVSLSTDKEIISGKFVKE